MGALRCLLRRPRMGVARAATTILLGTLALVAVYHISENRTEVVTESAPSSDGLPKDVDSFLEVAVSKTDSMAAFHHYQMAKEEAAKTGGAKFETAVMHCKTHRTASCEQCATHYCDAKKACGEPCVKEYGSPPRQIVPLTEGTGTRFYSVHEVKVKENRAKEHRAKEQDAKYLAKMERKDKETKYKEKVKKEKEHKEKENKERDSKELKEKADEQAHKAYMMLKCTSQAEKVEATCEEKKPTR